MRWVMIVTPDEPWCNGKVGVVSLRGGAALPYDAVVCFTPHPWDRHYDIQSYGFREHEMLTVSIPEGR